MTRSRFPAYFRDLAARMGLAHWTLDIRGADDQPGIAGALATITCCQGRTFVTIRLAESLMTASPQEQRDTCVHELVHLYFAASDTIVDRELSPSMNVAWRNAMEYGIDAVSKAIAPFLPLPPVAGAKTGAKRP